ncbi:tRNA (guanine-N7)-methyltransferase [Paenibacillus sp. 32O-W]|jgi:tRNA (guanine-N7-)-methyltransferase|uniref:tRNA (guanine-N(7)-)-methyltransferase n=1 Tax=Paenibacillus cisolokensis TaxID=1658519 RepID=A0ABQ4NED9_9BACL|nr:MULTISPECIES: tRNA (guanosine(46)-N7)-methyltransferase TrmB [Paenibacillus]ALS29417.1 tRNA (guanine-N7)-methyltransferase [Paenibacillus sp. 32O-W]GIQ66256.1 tRNA (guanine-N(7)-)-methyltransferase [Paenibacillus cisolokensis]
MRLRGRKGIRESLENQPDLVVLDAKPHRGRWHQFFGNDRPIYIELGMGKGRFISTMSATYPDINFIGVDMYDELLRRASEKARAVWAERGVESPPNLALLRANIEWIETMFAPGEIERIYLNFSDPWPKAKHARRRLTHPRFVAKYIELLNERGEIHLKTDSKLLFEFSLNSFSDMGLQLRNISLDLHRGGVREDLVLTEYESKFIEQGQPIHRCEVVVGREALAEHRAAMRRQVEGHKADTPYPVSEPSSSPATTSEG